MELPFFAVQSCYLENLGFWGMAGNTILSMKVQPSHSLGGGNLNSFFGTTLLLTYFHFAFACLLWHRHIGNTPQPVFTPIGINRPGTKTIVFRLAKNAF